MTACPRTFEVEALRDGRLGGGERAGFERHLSVCSACARELAALERLGAALRDSHPTSPDELEVRRARTRLLVAFNESLVGREAERGLRVSRRTLAAFSAGLAVAAATALWFGARSEQPAPPASAVTVRAGAGARWTRKLSEHRELITLDEGQLWIQVRRTGNEPPLRVVLPDGELEDLGTTFTVSAQSGRTTLVTVEEGSVLLRLHGRDPRTIGARGSWGAAPEAPAPREEPFEPIANAPSVPLSAARRSAPAPALVTAPRPLESAGPPAPSGASESFKAAMLALNRGDGRDAAARFSRFLEQYPRDPRAEDAAYLRVLAHQRSGDTAELQRAAGYYLRAYPAGFRRREVAALLPSVP